MANIKEILSKHGGEEVYLGKDETICVIAKEQQSPSVLEKDIVEQLTRTRWYYCVDGRWCYGHF